MKETILLILLSLSLSGGMMILLTLSICYLLQKKTSRQWQYYIWIIVLLRLALPLAPEKNLVDMLYRQIPGIAVFPAKEETPTNHAVWEAEKTDGSAASGTFRQKSALRASEDGSTTARKEQEDPNRIMKRVQYMTGYLCVLWLMVTALLFLRKVTIYQSFTRFIRAGSKPIDDISCLETLSSIEAELGIQQAVDLWSSPLASSPMLVGFTHPRIILPEGKQTEQIFYYTVMHELIHFKRKDMYYKWIVQLVICIHWFNPLIYILGKQINRLCELSCDEAVIRRLPSDDRRREYADTLLNSMTSDQTYRESLASLTLSENTKLLKERLEAIMKQKKNTTAQKYLAAILTIALAVTSLFSGNYVAGASSPQEEQQKAASNPGAGNKVNNLNQGITLKQSPDRSKKDKITAEQADEMALALTNQIWVWDWIEFFVPYMSEPGAKKLIQASRDAKWAGSVDMTTGKKIKFTKKQINAARKNKPAHALTCGDIDSHAKMIMQSNGSWNCISFMLPYMTRKGIRAVVRLYNSKHGGGEKRPEDYY